MRVRTQAFHVPKRGNAETEYEDAYFPEHAPDHEVTEFRCAVADGASESAFASVWARLLVRSFGRRRLRLREHTRRNRSQIANDAEPGHHLQQVPGRINLPPAESLPHGRRAIVMVVVPPLAEGDERQQ